MNPRHKRAILLLIRMCSDIGAVVACWLIAYFVRFHTYIEIPKGTPPTYLYFKLIPFIALIWFGVLYTAGFYRRSMAKRSAFLEAIDIIQSCALATLAFIAFTYFYEEYRYSRLTLFIFALLHPAAIITGRSAIRKALRYYRRNAPPRKLVLVSGYRQIRNVIAISQTADFAKAHILGVVLVGENQSEAEETCKSLNLPVIKAPENWTEFLHRENVQSVYFAVPNDALDYLDRNLNEIANQVTDIKILPDVQRFIKFSTGIDIYRGLPIINVHESPLDGIGGVVKRVVDVVLASVAVIFLAPFLMLLGFLVKLSSRGPVFYRQERMGIDGKTFQCLKFRSMPIGTEDKTGPVWAKEGESRATIVGSFLRKYSLDELPQLVNVILGDMSLVGPRPERPVFVSEFRKKIPGYMLRHKVRAGLTGWAQVNGWRGNTSIEKRIEFDLFYIRNWSLWLDFRIMGKTFAEVIFSKNAY